MRKKIALILVGVLVALVVWQWEIVFKAFTPSLYVKAGKFVVELNK